ncbi:MAG: hypothetical protein QGG54_15900 [Gammaproteobacteria bacterium]|jgi:hypothetical protein|nr:hypothetical protein [Gammaproteobacteria bacterium]MDP6535431.1 hypothetical protein [Gammaproteobacteria bacterium]MDP6732100.1 hypothetical protein [Gammaproteobacteria bacterium]HAJ76937.1 hypothetical protein [Gammaproteobacteria bacterium]|tara:strand:+ start:1007 stop:1444 length:438 start_codon:yes stop_codon:yes gene_type:complete
MTKTKLFLGVVASISLLYTPLSLAQSLVDGVYGSDGYTSDGDARGTGKCTLTIKKLDESHKYGDEAFELESSGTGSCEWTAIGISKNYAINAGMVTGGGATAFVTLKFPFGPAGKRIELTSMDSDGTVRSREVFNKLDDQLLTAE